jgi:hypothetical protein
LTVEAAGMKAILISASFLVSVAAFGGPSVTGAGNPVIEAIYGNGSPSLTVAGQAYELKEGQQLGAGYQVATDGDSAVRIVYPDNSQLYLGRNSSVEIAKSQGGASVTVQGAGTTRAIVSKGQLVSSDGKPRTKFLIRTKTAVLGVRGTDFVTQVAADGESTEVHALEGQVAVASPADEGGLFGGKGTLLGANQFLSAKLGAALGLPKAFQRAAFLQTLGLDAGLKDLMNRLPKAYDQLFKLQDLGNQLGNSLQKLDQLKKIQNLNPFRR